MKQLNSSDEVFRHLRARLGVDDDGDINAIALFAYALVEKDRVEWCEHRVSQGASAPTLPETTNWFNSKPESYFLDKERFAEVWYRAFARGLLHDELDVQER